MVVSHTHRLPAYPVPKSPGARVFQPGLCLAGFFSGGLQSVCHDCSLLFLPFATYANGCEKFARVRNG